MAEVKIQLTAENNATPVINEVVEKTRSVFGDMNAFMLSEARTFQTGWQGAVMLIIAAIGAVTTVVQAVDDSLDELHETMKSIERQISKGIEFKLDAGAAMKTLRALTAEIAKLDAPKMLILNVSGALAGVWRVKAAIDSIPDVTTKTVIIQYKTQASPVMPFSEGIRYIKEKMESLPRGRDYVLRGRSVGMPSGYRTETTVQNPAQQVTFSPTINIKNTSERDYVGLARELDLELARMWRYKRSELRKAVNT